MQGQSISKPSTCFWPFTLSAEVYNMFIICCAASIVCAAAACINRTDPSRTFHAIFCQRRIQDPREIRDTRLSQSLLNLEKIEPFFVIHYRTVSFCRLYLLQRLSKDCDNVLSSNSASPKSRMCFLEDQLIQLCLFSSSQTNYFGKSNSASASTLTRSSLPTTSFCKVAAFPKSDFPKLLVQS